MRFRTNLDLVLPYINIQPLLVFKMDYQSSYNSPQPGSSSGSPTYVSTASSALSQSLEAPSINYFSTLTDIEKPYISPYAQDDDLNNRGFAGPSQVSETSPANLLSSSEFPRIVEPNVIRSSSSSKASSAYSSPRPTHSPAPLAMNTSRTMSTVSGNPYICHLSCTFNEWLPHQSSI